MIPWDLATYRPSQIVILMLLNSLLFLSTTHSRPLDAIQSDSERPLNDPNVETVDLRITEIGELNEPKGKAASSNSNPNASMVVRVIVSSSSSSSSSDSDSEFAGFPVFQFIASTPATLKTTSKPPNTTQKTKQILIERLSVKSTTYHPQFLMSTRSPAPSTSPSPSSSINIKQVSGPEPQRQVQSSREVDGDDIFSVFYRAFSQQSSSKSDSKAVLVETDNTDNTNINDTPVMSDSQNVERFQVYHQQAGDSKSNRPNKFSGPRVDFTGGAGAGVQARIGAEAKVVSVVTHSKSVAVNTQRSSKHVITNARTSAVRARPIYQQKAAEPNRVSVSVSTGGGSGGSGGEDPIIINSEHNVPPRAESLVQLEVELDLEPSASSTTTTTKRTTSMPSSMTTTTQKSDWNWQEPERVWAEPSKVWGAPEKVWEDSEKLWGQAVKVWGEAEKTWQKPEEDTNPNSNVNANTKENTHSQTETQLQYRLQNPNQGQLSAQNAPKVYEIPPKTTIFRPKPAKIPEIVRVSQKNDDDDDESDEEENSKGTFFQLGEDDEDEEPSDIEGSPIHVQKTLQGSKIEKPVNSETKSWELPELTPQVDHTFIGSSVDTSIISEIKQKLNIGKNQGQAFNYNGSDRESSSSSRTSSSYNNHYDAIGNNYQDSKINRNRSNLSIPGREKEKEKSGKKFGYVLEGSDVKKYRVEERTPDGYIVGEYGVLNNENGFLRGVRYTADGTINPRLIHEALMKFLSL